MSILAVDMGGTNIKIGLVENGAITKRETLPAHSDRGAHQALSRTADVLRSLQRPDCSGVGFAFPTLVDVRTNRVVGQMIGKHEGLTRIDFDLWARDTLSLPIHIENDAHAAILGEWKFGAGRGCDDLVMMTLGTGIGTSVIINGKPLRGKHAQAGNLGSHMILDPNGFPCVCGGRGCGEAQQTRTALNELARADAGFAESALSEIDEIDYAALFRLADTDALAGRLLKRSLDIWGTMATSLVHQFDCERIILGGGIMRSADVILPHVEQWLATACTPWGRVEARVSELGDDAALFGMAVSLTQPLEYI
jgi:glucokinase